MEINVLLSFFRQRYAKIRPRGEKRMGQDCVLTGPTTSFSVKIISNPP